MSKFSHSNPKKQKGVALFVTLLVVTIASLLATEMWFNNALDIARGMNNKASYQANHYARGMALWANDILGKDFEDDAGYDSNSEIWNKPISGLLLEDAVLSGELSDMNGKFNLNNLHFNGQTKIEFKQYFTRILNNLEMDLGLADKIIDWLDSDQLPQPLGAEDSFYLSQRPSYRTAGQPFVHISELKLIAGISEQTYQRLKEYVTVLPIFGNNGTKVNVNTASTLLLKSLDNRISSQEALALYQQGGASFKTTSDFYQHSSISANAIDPTQLSLIIDTKTQWFHAQINVDMEKVQFQKFALIKRTGPTPVVEKWSETEFD